jgi:hypothetical protein
MLKTERHQGGKSFCAGTRKLAVRLRSAGRAGRNPPPPSAIACSTGASVSCSERGHRTLPRLKLVAAVAGSAAAAQDANDADVVLAVQSCGELQAQACAGTRSLGGGEVE